MYSRASCHAHGKKKFELVVRAYQGMSRTSDPKRGLLLVLAKAFSSFSLFAAKLWTLSIPSRASAS
jgi:hypothetical protein